MNVYHLLCQAEQEDALNSIVTSSVFDLKDFSSALENGCRLTAKVVYLAHLRGGREWLNVCTYAHNVTKEAANILFVLYDNPTDFWRYYLVEGDCNFKVKPNYNISYYVNRELTLNFLKSNDKWDDILRVVIAAGDYCPSRVIGDTAIYEWIVKNAPKRWKKEHNIDD